MLTPELIATIFYGMLSIGGGVIGYLKSRSKVSLISGGVSGLLLLVLALMMYSGLSWANPIAVAIISLLIFVFIVRWFKTKKPMPAFPMIFFGVVSLVLILR
ncbi:MAG: TMEM14 family protein [Xenococcus sp. MO_188.B8]|nr:TMEM14 family protein [Xenococcus sp. MO_188.B8]